MRRARIVVFVLIGIGATALFDGDGKGRSAIDALVGDA
jgi:hypothetical protein